MKGIFITFEGPDASGKTTQIMRLKSYLESQGIEPLMTREPGGTPISEKIRNIILDKENAEMMPVTEALLYALCLNCISSAFLSLSFPDTIRQNTFLLIPGISE